MSHARRASALALPWILIACGGGGSTDIESTLVFADRSDAEIARLISAAGGSDMFMAQGQVDQFGDTFDNDPCPTVAVSGDTVTVTGGCTRLDGSEVQGSATITNPLGWDQLEYQYGADSFYQFDQLQLIDTGWTQTFDGFVRRSDDFTTWDADVTADTLGMVVRSDLYYHCSNPSNPSCTLSGSGLELIGVGGARVSGKVTIDTGTQQQVSDFTLQGADKLTVHVAGNCVAWSIEGTGRGATCP